MSLDRRIAVMTVGGDDVTRARLGALFHGEYDIGVVAEATTGEEAIRRAAGLAPDVVVVDGSWPDGAGLEVCRHICARVPTARMLALVEPVTCMSVLTALRAGADGCVAKRSQPEDLRRAVRRLAAGEPTLDSRVTRVLLDHLRRHPARAAADEAAPTVERVLTLVGPSKTDRAIRQDAALAMKTARSRLDHVFSTLRGTRRAEVARLFRVTGASPDDDAPGAA